MNEKKITLYESTLILACVSIAVGLVIVAFQIYQSLVYGLQVQMSVLDAIFFVDENVMPMGNLPANLYQLLKTVPLAFVLILFGVLLLVLAFFGSRLKKESARPEF